jgi:cyclohexanecarboxylate-CoA ligase
MRLSSADRISDYTRRDWWGRRTVDDAFRDAIRAAAGEPALADPPNRESLTGSPPRRLTFGELDEAVDRFAALLLSLGCRNGDVVAVQMPNVAESVVAFLACARLGLIFCPISTQFRSHELAYMLQKSRARVALSVERLKDSRLAARLASLQAGIPALEHVLVATGGERIGYARVAPGVGADGSPEPPIALAAIELPVAAQAQAQVTDYCRAHPVDAFDTLTICWTSGTEARPKGVPRHHAQWIANGEACTELGEVRPGDSILNPFPMINVASIGGMVMPWLMNRARLVQHHPFDLPVFLAQLGQERISYTVAPPAVLSQLLKNEALLKGTDLTALRVLGSGSAPLPPWMVAGWQNRFGIAIVNIFGSNEGCALFSTARDVPDPDERAQFFPRFGAGDLTWSTRFARKVRTRLVDPESGAEIVAPGHPGELRVDGALRLDGYWDDPALNASAFDEQGYFRTGDLFEIAGTGNRFYRFIRRVKDVIVRGGVKISPAELDGLIEAHPAIREAAFCGIPDEVMGERVALVAVPKPGEELSLDSVIAYLRGKDVAPFKLPERLRLVAELPRNALGKVLRRDLPALFA